MRHLPPIGDARLNRYARQAADHAHNAILIARLALQPDAPKLEKPKTVRFAPDPMEVRGIPAVGRNCPGHIAGTQPEHAIAR